MNWILPDISIILATLAIIFVIFLGVGKHLEVKEQFFRLWVAAWALSIVHYIGQFTAQKYDSNSGEFVDALFLGLSGIIFVVAAESIRGRALRTLAKYCVGAAIILAVWAMADVWGLAPALTNGFRYGYALAALFGLAGLSHWTHNRKEFTIGGAILAYTFFFWSACFIFLTVMGGSTLVAGYQPYFYQFSNLPKPIAAIGMLIYLLEVEKVNEQRQRDFTESLIENAPDGIFILDLEYNLTRVNKRFATMCAKPADELIGKPLAAFIDVPDGSLMSKGALSGEVSGIAEHYQSRIEISGRVPMDVLVTSKPIFNSGRVIGAMGIVKDITDRLRLEQQLRQSEKMASIGLMVSGVAHELNNPLTSVIGFTELALRDSALSPVSSSRLKIVLSEARRTRNIVQKLLSAVRQQKSQRSAVQINQLVADTTALREHDFEINNIEIDTQLDPEMPLVLVDASDIQQVLINLMQNAFDALSETGAGGQLQIRTSHRNGQAIVEVSDDGPGAVEPSKIFDPFYTTKEVGKGTGLGLSICYQIIQSHGGEISAQNQEKGVKFTIKLPAATARLADWTRETRSPVDPMLNGRVLVVDDEPMIVTLCETVLSSAGFEVESCLTGVDALKKLRDSSFDVIVTDYKMPGNISGADIYDWVRVNRPGHQSNIIFMTGDSVNPNTQSFLKECGSPVVFKPFDADELAAKVRVMVSESIKDHAPSPVA
jgi:two-component system NtrC family sensor kinase